MLFYTPTNFFATFAKFPIDIQVTSYFILIVQGRQPIRAFDSGRILSVAQRSNTEQATGLRGAIAATPRPPKPMQREASGKHEMGHDKRRCKLVGYHDKTGATAMRAGQNSGCTEAGSYVGHPQQRTAPDRRQNTAGARALQRKAGGQSPRAGAVVAACTRIGRQDRAGWVPARSCFASASDRQRDGQMDATPG